jgi:Cof subfamily protein (haloacid dehalogenase superfamily)
MIKKEFLRKIKLVVTDLDGTLVDDEDTISEETVTLVKELRKLGVEFTIATGRLLSAVTYHADKLEIKVPLITLDGTIVNRYPGEPSIFDAFLPVKHVKRAISLADKFLLNIALCHDSAIYYTEGNSILPTMLDKFGAPFEEVVSYDNYLSKTLEIVICGDDKQAVKHVANKMSFPYTFGIRNSFYKSRQHGGAYHLELRKIGISKAESMKRLQKHLKIKMKETAVVGDWYNDKSLFETDAIKIAVANAVPVIKKMADYVTKRTNNENGIAEFLTMLYKAKK